jgi:hypothetical protein
VDLLRGGLVVFDGAYYYPLAHLPKHDASDRYPVLTSLNCVMETFAGFYFHALVCIRLVALLRAPKPWPRVYVGSKY